MSEIGYFEDVTGRVSALALPFVWEEWIAEWSSLRKTMVSRKPSAFTRDEWAYLISFLAPDNLRRPFESTFGRNTTAGVPLRVFRPRGAVAIWLPNNVSLLGPLSLVLLSLSGCSITAKAGSQGENLSRAWIDYAIGHLGVGPLRTYLSERVAVESFSRTDPRNAGMAVSSEVRIVFGGDASAAAIHALPHPPGSVGFSFTDRQSRAWFESGAWSDGDIRTLARVFGIYGQSGCTSPRKTVLLDGSIEEARVLCDRAVAIWNVETEGRSDPEVHVASRNILAWQLANARGWHAEITRRHSAVLAWGTADLPEARGTWTLSFVPMPTAEALSELPDNIQTVGYVLRDPADPNWTRFVAMSRIKRFVPVYRMHHFETIWDGQPFWRGLFEEIEIRE